MSNSTHRWVGLTISLKGTNITIDETLKNAIAVSPGTCDRIIGSLAQDDSAKAWKWEYKFNFTWDKPDATHDNKVEHSSCHSRVMLHRVITSIYDV